MAEIKFGLKHLRKPIPAKTTRTLGIMAFIFSTLGSYMASAGFIPASLSSALQGLMSLGATICLGLIPFYGVDTAQKKVDIQDVAAMETDDKSKTE